MTNETAAPTASDDVELDEADVAKAEAALAAALAKRESDKAKKTFKMPELKMPTPPEPKAVEPVVAAPNATSIPTPVTETVVATTSTPVVEPTPAVAPTPTTPASTGVVDDAGRRWYATGKESVDGRKELVLLKGTLSAEEAAEAEAGGDSLAKLIQSKGVRISGYAEPVVDTAPTAPASTDGVKLAERRWYATGKTKTVGQIYNPAWTAPRDNVHNGYVLLRGILTEAEDSAASKGGAELDALVEKYGVEASSFAAVAPTMAAAVDAANTPAVTPATQAVVR